MGRRARANRVRAPRPGRSRSPRVVTAAEVASSSSSSVMVGPGTKVVSGSAPTTVAGRRRSVRRMPPATRARAVAAPIPIPMPAAPAAVRPGEPTLARERGEWGPGSGRPLRSRRRAPSARPPAARAMARTPACSIAGLLWPARPPSPARGGSRVGCRAEMVPARAGSTAAPRPTARSTAADRPRAAAPCGAPATPAPSPAPGSRPARAACSARLPGGPSPAPAPRAAAVTSCAMAPTARWRARDLLRVAARSPATPRKATSHARASAPAARSRAPG